MKDFKYIYGPVHSWRLGASLGIDLLSAHVKHCNFDCVYCQLGRTNTCETKRQIFVRTQEILEEVKRLPKLDINYITFSGVGEPTLARNLGTVIKKIKESRKNKIAVITNSSLIYKEGVREDLLSADLVMAKLDACNDEYLKIMNHPCKNIKFEDIYNGLIKFRKKFRGKLCLQIMFLKNNTDMIPLMLKVIDRISPYEVHINTPIRPSEVKPLSKDVIFKIRDEFKKYNFKHKIIISSVYDKEIKKDDHIIRIDKKGSIKRR